MDVPNFIVSCAVLVGTGVLIWLTVLMVRPTKPTFRLDQIRASLRRNDESWADVGDEVLATLVFVNDGPAVAPAVHAYTVGLYPGDNAAEFQFPPDGSPTIPVGERFELPGRFKLVTRPEGLAQRKYLYGDDLYFDLSGLRVRFEWGVPGKRRSLAINNLHHLQQNASPQVESTPPD
ncbi:MAG: hypothetical protein WED09_00515 [Homoserinimonas sp.]